MIAAVAGRLGRTGAELSLASGDGPLREAFGHGRPMLATRLSSWLGRWPGYVSRALDQGLCAVLVLPLQTGATRFGVPEFCPDREGRLRDAATAMAFAFADVATLLVRPTVDVADTLVEEYELVDFLHELILHAVEPTRPSR